MKDISRAVWFLITGLQTYKLFILAGFFILPVIQPDPLMAQAPDPVTSIRDLREGYLIIRVPAYKAKIDTLTSMKEREDDPAKKARLGKWLREALEERDTLLSDYVRAFKDLYQFSKVAYFFDYDGHNLSKASYYDLEGERIPIGTLSEKPLYYLYFERTGESRIDALVIYDQTGQWIPSPFPNNFSRGGVNFLFLKISDKNFPGWRVSKINKMFFKYWSQHYG